MTERILIVGSPYAHPSREAFLKKLTNILSELCSSLVVVGANEPTNGENVIWQKREIEKSNTGIERYISFVADQIHGISDCSTAYNAVFVRLDYYVLPPLYCRISDIPVASILTQRTSRVALNKLTKLNIHLSPNLVIESPHVLSEWDAKKHKSKAHLGATYVDTERFRLTEPYSNRENVIGYLGLLNRRKRVDNLLKAVPEVLETNPEVQFLIGGDGPLQPEVSALANQYERVQYEGFVSDDSLREFYNRMKLLVLPSESEGLPNVALEAMACGTPVLASGVGGVPDLIEDGINGFIMSNNKKLGIRSGILRSIGSDSLESISFKGIERIETMYTKDEGINRYEQILKNISK